MTCEPGFHAFRPYPRSRALYCAHCGYVIDVGAQAQPAAPESAEAAALKHVADLIDGRERGAAVQQELPFERRDADASRAHEILDERRNARFEQQIDDILAASGLDATSAESLRREALEFGPALDLEEFRRIALVTAGAGDRAPDRPGVEAT